MLEKFFNPASVAILGASNEEGKVGHAVMKNMVESGYGGRLHPVNPRADSVQGLKACGSLQEIEGGVDLAVFVIPPAAILKTIEELRGKGTDAAIVISAGFKETGTDGAALERELVRKAKEIGVRILGPNCLGLIDTHSRVNASFAAAVPPRGNVSIFSQSGAILTAMLDWAATNDVGVSKIISLGNEADLTEVEFLEFLGSDPTTEVILGYIEGLRDGRAFMEAAKKVSHSKPIIMIKGGGTAAGSRAASSHTGSLAGFDAAYDAAFRQCHVIRARTVMELFNMALGFAYQPLPEGPNLAIITNAGGPGIMASDACERLNLPMASFEKATVEELAKHLPPVANLYNPVDVIGDARADRYERALDAVLADPGVDGVLVLLTPQEMTEVERTAEVIGRFDIALLPPHPRT
ncbi:MAG: acetate--CoA ligase family protein, partial [Nitrospinota bacterium]